MNKPTINSLNFQFIFITFCTICLFYYFLFICHSTLPKYLQFLFHHAFLVNMPVTHLQSTPLIITKTIRQQHMSFQFSVTFYDSNKTLCHHKNYACVGLEENTVCDM